MSNLPNLFVVGVAKGGTTFLHSALNEHPEVFMSDPKEPHHFAQIEADPTAAHTLNRVASARAYHRLFRGATEPVVGESSTTYWWDPGALERLTALGTETHAIVSLRDPVERAFSHYLNDVREGCEWRPFAQTVALPTRPPANELRWGSSALRIDLGFYADRLASYREVFGDRLHVIVYEDLLESPEAEVARMFSFLGLKPRSPLPGTNSARNRHSEPRGGFARWILASKGLRRGARRFVPRGWRARSHAALLRDAEKPDMSQEAVALLAELYRPDTTRLETQLGRTLPWGSAAAAPVVEPQTRGPGGTVRQ